MYSYLPTERSGRTFIMIEVPRKITFTYLTEDNRYQKFRTFLVGTEITVCHFDNFIQILDKMLGIHPYAVSLQLAAPLLCGAYNVISNYYDANSE